jgi:hypothetical protein
MDLDPSFTRTKELSGPDSTCRRYFHSAISSKLARATSCWFTQEEVQEAQEVQESLARRGSP